MPIIMVYENNNLGNQQTDLHITVRNEYKLWALNFNRLCGMSCLLSIMHMNKYFLHSHDSGKLL